MNAPSLNRIREVWADGRPVTGVIATFPCAGAVQALAQTALDFVLVDMEHAPVDASTCHAMIAATRGTRLVPLVRVPELSLTHAKLPLDLGAQGICFPMVNTVADAQLAVRAVRYPPQGDRFWGPFYASMHHGLSTREYQERGNHEVMAIATIEHIHALANISEIVQVPGLDLVFIGPGDLATSMGHLGRVDHPEVQRAVSRLEQTILAGPVPLGGVAHNSEQFEQMVARGYKAIVAGFDWSILQRGVHAVIGPPR